ncbi:MAG: RNA pseudouridine synthase [Clostridia bacterium]|nr:RNA pseudouridine synthase [Clostridia bacterium]
MEKNILPIEAGEKFQAGRYTIRVLRADNHLLFVEKPANMPVQADSSRDLDLLTACKGFLKERLGKPGEVYLGLVHRLDRPVGGTMVFARTSKAASRLSEAFRTHDTDKRYWAVGQGVCKNTLHPEDWLLKDEKTGMVRVVPKGTPGAKDARLTARPIARCEGLTLFEVELETGRPHQIRVQLKNAGFPLWGDARYGGGQPGQQLCLWAHALTVEHPTKKEPVTVLSCPPMQGAWKHFQEILEENR